MSERELPRPATPGPWHAQEPVNGFDNCWFVWATRGPNDDPSDEPIARMAHDRLNRVQAEDAAAIAALPEWIVDRDRWKARALEAEHERDSLRSFSARREEEVDRLREQVERLKGEREEAHAQRDVLEARFVKAERALMNIREWAVDSLAVYGRAAASSTDEEARGYSYGRDDASAMVSRILVCHGFGPLT